MAVFMIFVRPMIFSSLGWRPCVFYQLTGLPCPFCGATRATHALLQGNFPLALYYNAIAWPALGATTLLLAALLFEAVTGIAVFARLARFQYQRTALMILVALLTAWWGWHIADALRTPKPELICPANPVCHYMLTHFGGPDAGAVSSKRWP